MTNPIDKLDEMLNEANIPHVKFRETYAEYKIDHSYCLNDPLIGPKGMFAKNQICYPGTYQEKNCKFDCIWQFGSYGSGDEVESYGNLGVDEDGEPNIMTIEEAFKIISEDWRKHNGTSIDTTSRD